MPEEEVSGFWGNFSELAKRMKVVIFTFIVSTIVMLVLPGNADFLALTNNYQPLMSVFLRTVRDMVLPQDVRLIALQIEDPITLYVMSALVFSIAITMPVLAYEVYKFVDPALHPHEKKAIYPFVSIVTVLFIAGGLFGFFFLFPAFVYSMFPFFTAVGAEMIFSIMDFYNLLFFTIIISGVIFTIPAFFVLLVKFGIVHTKMFSRKRKYVYLGIVVLAMLITPGATPQGNLYLSVALIALFEVSMFMGKRYERHRYERHPNNLTPFNLFPTPTCRFCNKEVDGNSDFCPACKRSLN
jgi:sec-independent protein translocase protein TatC